MISMDLKQHILHCYRVEEKSLREIARLTKTDRKTVSRLVHDFEAAIEKYPDLGMTEFLATAPHLLTLIREARTNKTLQSLEFRFKRYDLVICDEMGYVGFDKEGAEMLFNHLSLRSGTKATIITTNLPFTRWEEIMKDKVLCSALVDRLCHKAYLVNMTGQSYRVRETQNMLKRL